MIDNPLYSFSEYVFQPGGVNSANVFTDWNALMLAIQEVDGPKRITLDNDFITPIVIPAGTYDLDYCVLSGKDYEGPLVGTAVTLTDGVIFQNLSRIEDSLWINANNTVTPVITMAATAPGGPFLYLVNNVALRNNGTQPFIMADLTAGGLVNIVLENQAGFFGGAYEILELVGTSGSVNIVMMNAAMINPNTLRDVIGANPIGINYFDAAAYYNQAQINLNVPASEVRYATEMLIGHAINTFTVSPANLTRDYEYVVMNVVGASIVNLPDMNLPMISGKEITVKTLNAGPVTITPFAGQTIDGVANYVLNVTNNSVKLIADFTNLTWHVV